MPKGKAIVKLRNALEKVSSSFSITRIITKKKNASFNSDI